MINNNIEVKTTAELDAFPTPAVPFLLLYPLKQPTSPMAKPKKKVLIVAGKISLNFRALKTWLK